MNLPKAIHFTIFDDDHADNRREITIPKTGYLTLVGPNGSGKSHLLRGLKRYFTKNNDPLLAGKAVRYLPSGRVTELGYSHYSTDSSARLATERERETHYDAGTIATDYQVLKERADIQLKVRARLRESFKRDIRLRWGSNGLEVDFEHEAIPNEPSEKLEYSIGQEASGLVQLVGLLSALYNDEIGLLIIDEPELSLHPQYQNFLLEEIRKVSGAPTKRSNHKIVMLATHSPEFVKFSDIKNDLPSFCLCESVEKSPIQVLEFRDEFEDNSLIQRISYQYKKALFAQSVLLVEGDTDEMICRALASRQRLELETSGIQLVSVGSKEDFYSAIIFFRAIQKKVHLLADVDWLVDRPSGVERFFGRDLQLTQHVTQILETPWDDYDAMLDYFREHSYGFGRFKRILSYLEREMFDQEGLSTRTILEALEGQINQLIDHSEYNSFSTALSRISFCKIIEDPNHPMHAILDELETRGAFIIRNGELESSYTTQRVSKKRVWAMREYRAIMQDSMAKVERHYGDIIRCLKSSSSPKEHTELNMLHNALVMLAMELHNYFYKSQYMEIERALYRIEKEGIFKLEWDRKSRLIRILLSSNLFAISDLNITIEESDDITYTKQKIDNVFREYGLPLKRVSLHEC